ncbi:hypothetical protein thsrh120_63640 [Rhizobium sp. No.120]
MPLYGIPITYLINPKGRIASFTEMRSRASNVALAARPDETFWRLEVEIFPGKLREFKAIVHEQLASAA